MKTPSILQKEVSYKTAMFLTVVVPILVYLAYVAGVIWTVYTYIQTDGSLGQTAAPALVTYHLRRKTTRQRMWIRNKLIVKR